MVLALGMGFAVLAAALVAGAALRCVAGAWAVAVITVTKNIISFMFFSQSIYGDLAY